MYIRKLPSGKWQATVRMPNGKKVTSTDPLKSVARKWATELEAQYNRGEVRDPRVGEIRVEEWHDRVSAARVLDTPTKKNASLWRTHCEDRWGTWPMNAVTRMEAQEWVNDLVETRRARHKGRDVSIDDDDVPTLSAATVRDIVFLMGGLYKAAMKEHPPIVLTNPFADLELPKRSAWAIEFYERDEAGALYDAFTDVAHRTLVELGMDVGLRPGEIYGLHGHRVDWIRGKIHVTHVMTRDGLREYPKSMMSRRTVPVPPGTLERMSTLMVGRPRTALVFTAPAGGPIDDGDFRNRIWYPAVEASGIRRFPPRIMRHTAASWLVQDGVPLYDVQALLGHEDYATTQRYAHLQPDAHSRVAESWARRSGAPGARGAHEQQEGGSR
ncbi:tyrosine-type recombinase/integrase [Jiangella endophytica]|uniref:tyrosine-type recombinase/integrase n=1 Tax=Jiangella endophytica TaxID=1623398 RepID=UPI000E341589|nr:tyrosine-type recombinase/integrase [Jiangella endophytica]